MERIDGTVAFITGGAGGMGLGMARVFSRAGMRVVIADIRQGAIDAALGEFPADNPGVFGVQLDVADRAWYAVFMFALVLWMRDTRQRSWNATRSRMCPRRRIP